MAHGPGGQLPADRAEPCGRDRQYFRFIAVPDQTLHINASIPFPIWDWMPTNEVLGDTEANLLQPGQISRGPSRYEILTAEGDAFDVSSLEDGSDGHEDAPELVEPVAARTPAPIGVVLGSLDEDLVPGAEE